MSTSFIYDPHFLDHETGTHPETPGRLEVIHSVLEADRTLWSRLQHVEPAPASDEDITRCHSAELIDHIREASESGAGMLDADTIVSAQSFDVARLAAGAATVAVDCVVRGETRTAFVASRPPGHHARPNKAMGFCLFNNAAIGARYAQARHGLERILIVDWDVHHGNGTQEIFYSDPDVFYLSTHQYPYYPGTGAANETGEGPGANTVVNVPLPSRTSARAHRTVFSDALADIERRFRPDLIIISAGFDSRREDPLGGLLLEDTDFVEMTKEVMGFAERHAEGRVVALLEGGYNLDNLGRTVRDHIAILSG
jgi:acetoin utilization deacetylase AcuC-like enzyme